MPDIDLSQTGGFSRSGFTRLEEKVDRLTEAVTKMVLVEERQINLTREQEALRREIESVRQEVRSLERAQARMTNLVLGGAGVVSVLWAVWTGWPR